MKLAADEACLRRTNCDNIETPGERPFLPRANCY